MVIVMCCDVFVNDGGGEKLLTDRLEKMNNPVSSDTRFLVVLVDGHTRGPIPTDGRSLRRNNVVEHVAEEETKLRNE